MDILEGVDWEGLGEFIQPAAGLIVALLFMGFVRLMKKTSRRRKQSPEVKAPRTEVKAPRTEVKRVRKPALKYSVGATPIEPGDDAAKLSRRFSQSS